MCGRFTLTFADPALLAMLLDAIFSDGATEGWQPRFNIAPQTVSWALVSVPPQRHFQPMLWGWTLPNGKLLINARSETLARKPTFCNALTHHRCLIIADGFYEWRREGGRHQPFWFHRPDRQPFFLAALSAPTQQRQQERQASMPSPPPSSYVIITTAADQTLKPIHDRMPAIISLNQGNEWLQSPATDLLRPAPDDFLQATPVSTLVNSVRYDSPDCITEVLPPSGIPQQLKLW